ncbi:MAG: hypothetical protein F4Z01_00510 [Gammaproteobacteria bacterium]|nr:hypothetical protein [Gammaproteobacteria bacterium]MYF38193.1 hypothetical protein [Gammaproteobacteria bacterium]
MNSFLKHWFVSSTIVFIIVGIGGCASFPEPRMIQRNFIIEAPKDLVWDGAIHYFSSQKIPISRSEEDSGIIFAERSFHSSIKDDKYADCPKGHMLGSRRSKMNIFISEPRTDVTKLRIKLQFQREYTASSIHGENLGTKFYDCASTGVGEREIYEKVLEYVALRWELPSVASAPDEKLHNN